MALNLVPSRCQLEGVNLDSRPDALRAIAVKEARPELLESKAAS